MQRVRRILCILAVVIGSSLVSLAVSGLFTWNAVPTRLTNQFYSSISLLSMQLPVHHPGGEDTGVKHRDGDVSESWEADTNADSSYNSEQVNSFSSEPLPQDVEVLEDDGDASTLNSLPESVIDGVKKFVFFIDHCRSGHSI